jgi:hypothetical protein
MKIYKPRLLIKKNQVRYYVKVKLQRPNLRITNCLWFEFPKKYSGFISSGSDAFLACLLLLAMFYKEDIFVSGKISEKLLRGLNKYQAIFNRWCPDKFHKIKIFPEKVVARLNKPKGVGAAFSGGVDSSYTLLQHLSKITHCLFVHGFDIPLSDKLSFKTASRAYQRFLSSHKIKLITIKTNIREVAKAINWNYYHGSALIGTALLFQKIFLVFYVPSSDADGTLIPWGSHPKTDPLLSTESTEIIHYGLGLTRFNKLEKISNWKELYTLLRVCWEKTDGLRNCCRCDRCIQTMTMLSALGKLQSFTTFPLPLTGTAICNCVYKKGCWAFWGQSVLKAREKENWGLVFSLHCAMFRSKIINWFDEVIRNLKRFKHTYLVDRSAHYLK